VSLSGQNSSIILGTAFTLAVWAVMAWLLLRLAGVELRRQHRRADQPPGSKPSR
jgi:hypothetical protein